MFENEIVLYGPDGNHLPSAEERSMTVDDVLLAWKAGQKTGTQYTLITEANAYRLNAWVHACVSAISRIVASTPFRLTKNNKKTGIVESGPEYELFRKPSPRKSRYELWYGTISMLELTGNALWWMDMKNPTSKTLPRALRLLDSRMVRTIRDQNTGELIGYTYMVAGTNTNIALSLNEIIHFMYPNPYDPWWGLGPLQAAMSSVRSDYKVSTHNDKFFDNGAQLGGILINKRGINSDQLKQMREQFDSQYSGQNAAHKTAILSGDWDYKPFMIGQREMEFMDQRKFVRETIGAVFGTPGIIINDPNNRNYATAAAELRLFAENNWLPKIRYIEDFLDAQFFDRFSPGITGFFDTSDSPGLRADLAEKAKTAQTFFKMGAPWNEIIDKLDLPFKSKPWGQTWWVTTNDVPVDTQLNPVAPKPAPTPADAVGGGDAKPLEGVDKKPKPKPQAKMAIGIIDSQARDEYWALMVKKLSPVEKRVERKMSRYFFELGRELDASLGEVLQEKNIDAVVIQGVLSANRDGDSKLLSACRDILLEAFELGYQSIVSDLGVQLQRDDDLVDKFKSRVDSISTISESLLRRLNEAAEDVVDFGYKRDEALGLFKRLIAIAANNSKEIARTETYSAMNYGRLAAMQSFGIHRHEWLSARDEASRCHSPFIHTIDGEVASLGEEFSNGLRFPTDSGGSLSESSNTFKCRCLTIPVLDQYLPEG